MQEKCKLKIKAIPAVDARPTKEGSKPAQHNFDVEAASPGCRLGLGRWFALPKGPIGVEGKRGGESLFGWPLAWEFPVPLPTGRANCRGWSLMFPLVPTPPTPISQGESVHFRPPKVHTHTQPGPSPHWPDPTAKRRRLNNTCRLVSVQGPGAVGGLVARRSVASTYTWACDGRRTQQSQPARQRRARQWAGGGGEVGEGRAE